MRQAGRYLPSYQALRKKHTLWELFHSPTLAAQVTHLPFEVLPLDAAILFSDILVIAEVFGYDLTFPEGKGPVLLPPLETTQLPVAETLSYVFETIRLLKPTLKVPLIGFCGGPYTVASYMMGKQQLTDPAALHLLLEKLTAASIEYLQLQIQAGVDAIQIFDSWAGLLPPPLFNEFSLKYLKQIIEKITVPVIISAVEATGMIMRGETERITFPLAVLVTFSIVYLSACYMVIDYVVEE